MRRVTISGTTSEWALSATNTVTITVQKLLRVKIKDSKGDFKDAPIASGDPHLNLLELTQEQIDTLANLPVGAKLPSHKMEIAFTKEIDGDTGKVISSSRTVDGVSPGDTSTTNVFAINATIDGDSIAVKITGGTGTSGDAAGEHEATFEAAFEIQAFSAVTP